MPCTFKRPITNFGVISKTTAPNQFRIVSSIYLQNLKVRQLPEPELLAIFKGYSKCEITFVDSLSVMLLCFVKTLCNADDADIQDNAPTQRFCTVHYLLLLQ